MAGHDPFRALTPSLGGGVAVAEPPAALTGDAAPVLTIPDGNVAEVVAYIDKGRSKQARRDRAAAVLAAEQASGKPRKGVVKHAETVLAG